MKKEDWIKEKNYLQNFIGGREGGLIQEVVSIPPSCALLQRWHIPGTGKSPRSNFLGTAGV